MRFRNCRTRALKSPTRASWSTSAAVRCVKRAWPVRFRPETFPTSRPEYRRRHLPAEGNHLSHPHSHAVSPLLHLPVLVECGVPSIGGGDGRPADTNLLLRRPGSPEPVHVIMTQLESVHRGSLESCRTDKRACAGDVQVKSVPPTSTQSPPPQGVSPPGFTPQPIAQAPSSGNLADGAYADRSGIKSVRMSDLPEGQTALHLCSLDPL